MNVYWNILLTLEFQILIKSHLISWLLSCHVSHLKYSLSAWSFKFHFSSRTSASTSDAVGLEGGQIPYLVALMLMASGHLRRRRTFPKVHNFALLPRESKWRRVGVATGEGNSIRNKQRLLKTCNIIAAAKRGPRRCRTQTYTWLSVRVFVCVCVWQQHVVVHGPHAQLTVHTITRQIIKYVQRQCNVQVVSPSHSFWRLVAKYLHCN